LQRKEREKRKKGGKSKVPSFYFQYLKKKVGKGGEKEKKGEPVILWRITEKKKKKGER